MAEGPQTQDNKTETGTRPPPLTAEQFIASPEFKRFKKGMRKILKVSKTEIDRRVKASRKPQR